MRRGWEGAGSGRETGGGGQRPSPPPPDYTPQLRSLVSLLRSTPMKMELPVVSETSEIKSSDARLLKGPQYGIQHTAKV